MKSSIIYGLLAAIIVFVFMYLDTKLLDNPKSKVTYCKNMLLMGSIVGFGIHLIGDDKFDHAIGLMSEVDQYLGELGENIDIGEPDF